jgi:hypothetical protein
MTLKSYPVAKVIEMMTLVIWICDYFLFETSQRWDVKLRHLGPNKPDSNISDSTQNQKSGRNSNPRQVRT